jgi:hypothetical protein
MRLKNKCYLAVLLLVSVVSSKALFAAPSITSLSPTSGAVGTSVTITGTNFGTTQGTSAVTFNGTTATAIASWAATSIVATVPTGATTGGVVVTVGGVASNSVNFTVATASFALTGNLATARMFHTATLLNSGTVLVAGGVDGFVYDTLPSAELYNPATGTFTTTGNLNTGRIFNTATLLSNGQVLVVGGSDSNWNQIGTAELYNPASGTFTFTGSLNTARTSHSSTLLNNGKVLIAGGWNSNGNYITSDAGSGELYDPTTGTFVSTGSLNTARDTHTATLLNDGTVLIAGGFDSNANPLSSAEIYDPVAGTFTLTGSLNIGRAVHTATLLNNGMVLIAGGYDLNGNAVASAELYNPATGSFTVTGSLNTPRYDGAQGTLLNNGMVLLAGGQDNNGNTLASAELYDPATGSFTATSSMNVTRQSLTTTLLNNGQVLVSAGMDYYATVLNTAELYQPSTLTPAGLVSIAVSPSSPSVSVGTTQIFTATGTFSDNSTQTLASVTWTSSDRSIAAIANDASNRGNAVAVAPGSVTVSACTGSVCGSTTMTILPPSITSLSPSAGAVGTLVTITGTNFGLIQGASIVSFNGTAATPTSWSSSSITVPVPSGATAGNVVVTVGGIASNGIIFTVQSVGFVASSGQMGTPRYGHTATRLMTGQVLIAGGMSSSGVVNSVELYTPASQTFAVANAMNVARWSHTATLLNDGTVLVAGGSSVSSQTTLNSAEIYDPVAGIFTLLPNSLNTARVGHSATLLSNGQVLIVGGYDPTTGLIADAELYDPTAQVFIDLGNTNSPRFHHTATLLQNGQVLIAGGETDPTPTGSLNTAEIFNPATWTFTALSVNMTSAREGHTATLLNNGQVLLTGGDPPGAGTVNTAEIYDPASKTFTALSSTMTTFRMYHDAVLLNGGKVLLSGGGSDSGGSSTVLNSAEVYDPTSQTFTAVAGNTTGIGEYQTATLLNDGTVLLDGGTNGTSIFNTAEIYTTSKLTGLTGISISPASPSVPLGSQQLLTATGTFSGGGTQVLSSVSWSSSSTAVSAVSNDASDIGYLTTASQGTATITATGAGVSASATLTVTAPTLVSITLSPLDPTIPVGTSQQFTATGVYSDGSTQDLTSTATWSSPPTVVIAVISSGLGAGLFQGTATIQVSVGSVNASTTITVAGPALVSMAVTPASATVAQGSTQQYQAIGTYSDGSTQNVTSLLTWSSGTPTVATVVNTGLATGWSQGTATLSGAYQSISASATLTVTAPTLVSVTVGPKAASISTGAILQLTSTGTYTDGSTQNLTAASTWVSSNSSVISVTTAGLATAVATGNATITATFGSTSGASAWVVTTGTTQSSLNTSRYLHNATILNNGQILVAGGISCSFPGSCTYLNTAELYSPASSAFATTGQMATARSAPAVLLSSGKVLTAGGYTCDASGNCSSLIDAEIYDPVAGAFSSAGSMTVARSGHTLTVLQDGTVLIAGGQNCTSATSCSALSSAEIYDPNAGTFTATSGNMNAARFGAAAVLLNSGLVLIAGGFDGSNLPATAEIYQPSGTYFPNTGPNLIVPRFDASATLLNNGQVLVTGGSTCSLPGCPTNAAEIFDPIANTFTVVSGGMTVPRFSHSATLLTNGNVFVAGGYSSCGASCNEEASTEVFDPAAGVFSPGQSITSALAGHTGTLVGNGNVLLIGGINTGVTLSGDEWYQPTSLTPAGLVSVTIAPTNLFLALGQSQQFGATGTFSNGSTQILQSAIWNSSNPAIASISNSPGSAGIANALATGATTLTATAGSAGGSASLNAAGLVSLTITPGNPSISVGTGQQLTASGTFSDSSVHDMTSSVTWSTSNASTLMMGTPNAGLPGFAMGANAGTATVTATFGGMQATVLALVQLAPPAPTPPSISIISPTFGSAGTQVTITGSGFGSTEGTGNVWLGSTFGNVVSWSGTQIVATVAVISTSGTAQVQQGGLSSNTVPFNVSTATISNILPKSGVPGTQVTITGSGFGATQGSGQAWLGTANAVVQSWSDTQIIAVVAIGSMSANAQVLQNGVMTNAVPFSVTSLSITNITPNSGAAGTTITITGSGFGSTQGNGTVLIGGTNGEVMSWNDTQIVALVAPNAVTGVARVEQNGIWSNAVSFTVPSSGDDVVSLAPDTLSLIVGQTYTIQAENASGQPVTGLNWTSSNPNIVTLSTDDPPLLTAVAAGHVTITAGSASADIIVTYLTQPGTPIWSNSGDGFAVASIVPAIPSATGVADVFAFRADGTVQAITGSGTTAWTASLPAGAQAAPDFLSGLVVANLATQPQSIMELNATGVSNPPFTVADQNDALSQPAVHTDGTIFTVYTDNTANTASVVGIDPTTGNQKFKVQMDPTTLKNTNTFNGQTTIATGQTPPTILDGPIIAGDGYAYVAYEYFTQTFQMTSSSLCNSGNGFGTSDTVARFMLMRVGTDGSSSKMNVQNWESRTFSQFGNPCNYFSLEVQVGSIPYLQQAPMITNRDQGLVLSWEADTGGYCASENGSTCYSEVPEVSTFGLAGTFGSSLASSTTFNIPGQAGPVVPVLQAQDGTFFGTVGTGPAPGQVTQTSMISFDSSANVKWSVPNESPKKATADNGAIGVSGITYDDTGKAIVQITQPTESWKGNGYEITATQVLQVPLFPTPPASPTYASFSGANLSGNGTSPLCGDDRDQLTPGEYVRYGADFFPSCFEFISSGTYVFQFPSLEQSFQFSKLNQDDTNDHPNWAILRASMVNGLGSIQNNYSKTANIQIDSGYRSPKVQSKNGHPHDRHIHGDAVDIAAGTQGTYRSLRAAALQASSKQTCVEDLQTAINDCKKRGNQSLLCPYNHVHADWRRVASPVKACNAEWMK